MKIKKAIREPNGKKLTFFQSVLVPLSRSANERGCGRKVPKNVQTSVQKIINYN